MSSATGPDSQMAHFERKRAKRGSGIKLGDTRRRVLAHQIAGDIIDGPKVQKDCVSFWQTDVSPCLTMKRAPAETADEKIYRSKAREKVGV